MKNVMLVCGGESYEHDISVVTATQIFSKTRLDDVNLIFLYISRNGTFFVYESKKIDLKDFSVSKFSPKNKKFKEVVFVSSEKNKLFVKTFFGLKEYANVNIAIMCTHGGCGENGRLVSFFEDLNIMTTSGNFDSLAVCMNKYLFKQVMKGIKVPIVKGFRLKKGEFEKNKKVVKFKLDVLKYPVVIKPANGGSSIGLFVANNEDEFLEKISDAFLFDNEILIERFIAGAREFNVAVIGNGENLRVSAIDEPLKNDEVLTFADKYLKSEGAKKFAEAKCSMAGQKRQLPADIDEELKEKIQSIAMKIFKALNLCGVVRIDFLYDEALKKLYVCEVNSVPGSLAYYFFSRGFLINNFVKELIEIAEHKANEQTKISKEFMPSILD